jgi:hypothetical protein
LTKKGFLRRQQKPIDPRYHGNKTLLTRLVVLDVDTGSVYGEIHSADTSPDLLGFLARAWSVKASHPMHGIPEHLNIPKAVTQDASMSDDLRRLANAFHFSMAPLASGFSAGIHAVKKFEIEVESLIWRLDQDIELEGVLAISGVVSHLASSGMSLYLEQLWREIPVPGDDFYGWVDAQYEIPGGWRLGPYEMVLKGLPQRG